MKKHILPAVVFIFVVILTFPATKAENKRRVQVKSETPVIITLQGQHTTDVVKLVGLDPFPCDEEEISEKVKRMIIDSPVVGRKCFSTNGLGQQECYLFLNDSSESLNLWMIKNGLAKASGDKHFHSTEFRLAMKRAKDQKSGLWNKCGEE